MNLFAAESTLVSVLGVFLSKLCGRNVSTSVDHQPPPAVYSKRELTLESKVILVRLRPQAEMMEHRCANTNAVSSRRWLPSSIIIHHAENVESTFVVVVADDEEGEEGGWR